MQETQAAAVVTPDEEVELRYPVRAEQPTSSNFTPVQIVILFIQFCLVGVFLGAIFFNDSDHTEVASPPKVIVVAVEREKKAGGGFKYRLVGGNKGDIEAIVMESVPSEKPLATIDVVEENEQTTAIQWMKSPDPPLKIISPWPKFTGPPQQSFAKDASMPSPPVPPPWSTTSSPGRMKEEMPKERPTTRTPFKFSFRRHDFYRG